MAIKHRVEGAEAIFSFMTDMKLLAEPGKTVEAVLSISAKAGDKWRITRLNLPVQFECDDKPGVTLASIAAPFYKSYGLVHGTRFTYDTIKAKLFIEGHLNKGRGDPYVVCLSR